MSLVNSLRYFNWSNSCLPHWRTKCRNKTENDDCNHDTYGIQRIPKYKNEPEKIRTIPTRITPPVRRSLWFGVGHENFENVKTFVAPPRIRVLFATSNDFFFAKPERHATNYNVLGDIYHESGLMMLHTHLQIGAFMIIMWYIMSKHTLIGRRGSSFETW